MKRNHAGGARRRHGARRRRQPEPHWSDRPWTSSYSPGVPAELKLPKGSLVDLMDSSVRRFGAKTALEFFGATTSYRELGTPISRAAAGLKKLGVKPGDRVALVLPNCPQHVVAFYAALRLGAVVVEHNPLYTDRELRHQFEDHGATVADRLGQGRGPGPPAAGRRRAAEHRLGRTDPRDAAAHAARAAAPAAGGPQGPRRADRRQAQPPAGRSRRAAPCCRGASSLTPAS